jgi:hypothetical protein
VRDDDTEDGVRERERDRETYLNRKDHSSNLYTVRPTINGLHDVSYRNLRYISDFSPHLGLEFTVGKPNFFATCYQVNIKCLPVRHGASYSPLFQSRLVTSMRYIVHLLKQFFQSQPVCGFGSNTNCTSFV